MANSCSFTGTRGNIPDYTLGGPKEIAGMVVVVKSGIKATETIRNASWKIGSADSGVVKDYQITGKKGEVTPLSEEDWKRNPVSFKLWESASGREFIRCSGESSQGPVTAEGSVSVHIPVTGTFEDSCFHGPVVKQGYELRFPSFSRRLVSSFDLRLDKASNGTLGVIHLVKSKITQIDSSGQETIVVDTGNDFVLHTPHKGIQDPVQDRVEVAGGVLQGTDGSAYEFDLEIFQPMEPEYSYRFEEEYRSYLFFRGNGAFDIWHPVGFEKDQASSPVYMRCAYVSSVYYDQAEELWRFPDYTPTSPSFSKADRLPEWNRNIHACVRREISGVLKKEVKPLATEHNVDVLIHLCGLAPDAPEMDLPSAEKVAFVDRFLRSQYGGTIYFALNYAFANAKHTTYDPKDNGTAWVTLWRINENHNNPPVHCTSEHYPVYMKPCGPVYVGGHVIDGKIVRKPKKGSNNVYIFPICVRHNNNNNVHMEATHYFRGVWLKNFMW